jgi:two-component system NtrC family response regulator
MAKLCERYCTETKGFSPEFFETLAAYSWPGNVRELVSTLESVLVSAGDEPTLFPKHLPTHIRVQVARASVSKKAWAEEDSRRVADPSKTFYKLKAVRAAAVAQAEKRYLQDVVSLTGNNIQEVCRISGLRRSRLYGLLRKHSIPPSH